MLDPSERDDFETKLSKLMKKQLREYGERIIDTLGNPPDINNLTPEFWENESKIMSLAIIPVLEKIYLEAAREVMLASPSAVDWTLVNQAAADWAKNYTFDLIKGIDNTTTQALQRVLASYFENPTTMEQLTAQILELIGSPIRAEMIAVTEVTRAASEGEQAIARELARQGIIMTPFWNTNRDELVCPICEPRNNQEITDGMFPPAHPRCRCWVNYELPKPGRRMGQQ